jgi:hypothetical protein
MRWTVHAADSGNKFLDAVMQHLQNLRADVSILKLLWE